MVSSEAGPELSPSRKLSWIHLTTVSFLQSCRTEHRAGTNFLTAGGQVQSIYSAQWKLLQGGCGWQVRISWVLSVDVTWLRSRAGSLTQPLLTEARTWAKQISP